MTRQVTQLSSLCDTNDSASLELPPQGLLRDQELNTDQEQSTRAPGPVTVADGAGAGAAVDETGPIRLLVSGMC